MAFRILRNAFVRFSAILLIYTDHLKQVEFRQMMVAIETLVSQLVYGFSFVDFSGSSTESRCIFYHPDLLGCILSGFTLFFSSSGLLTLFKSCCLALRYLNAARPKSL